MLVLALIAIIAYVLWLVFQAVPAPAWVARVMLAVLLGCLTLIAAGITLET